MSNRKDGDLRVYLEPEFEAMIRSLAEKEGISTSRYARGLMLTHLQERGLVTIETLMRALR